MCDPTLAEVTLLPRTFYAACFLFAMIFFQVLEVSAAPSAPPQYVRVYDFSASSLNEDKPSQVAIKLADKAKLVAQKTNTIGWCFAAIKKALNPFGIHLEGAAAYLAKDQLEKDQRFIVTAFENLQPGDILVHGKNVAHPYGHIAIYLGKEEEASDHVQKLIDGQAYGGTTIFRIKPWNPVGDAKVGPARVSA